MSDKKRSPAFLMYTRDFLASIHVQAMSVEEVGAYCLLLFTAWHQEKQGYLPDDQELLRKICRMTPEQWQSHSSAILAPWRCHNGAIFCQRLVEEKEKQLAYKKTRSAAGKRGAEAKWNKKKARKPKQDNDLDGRAMAEPDFANGKTMANDGLSSSFAFACINSSSDEEDVKTTGFDPAKPSEDSKEKPAKNKKRVAEFFAEWNRLPEPVPHVKKITTSRRNKLRQRFSDPWWRDNWRQAVRKIPDVPFLLGNNNRGWTADVDFFLRPDTVAKIVEGKYDDNGAGHRPDGDRDADGYFK